MRFDMELVIPSLRGEADERVKVGEAWLNQNQEMLVNAIPVDQETIAKMVEVQKWKEGGAS